MNSVKTTSDYIKMLSKDKKKFTKMVIRGANEDQRVLVENYESAVKERKIEPVGA